MQDNVYGYMPAQYNNPMNVAAEAQLENMYPNVYNIVNPVVEGYCNNMCMQYGNTYTPNKQQVEAITEDIMKKVEPEVTKEIEKESGERQLGFGGRRLLRNLIGILFIRNLLDRRRRPFGFFPGYGYPYYGGFYGF